MLVCPELHGCHAFLASLWFYMLNKSSTTEDDMLDFFHYTLNLPVMYQDLEHGLCSAERSVLYA